MITFIDDHRGAYGVEPICKVLPIAPSTYRAHAARRLDPARLSPSARRDVVLAAEIRRVFEANFRVYGVRKVWRQLGREGIFTARCTVARLMRQQYVSIRYTERLAEAGIEPSVGSVGDSYTKLWRRASTASTRPR